MRTFIAVTLLASAAVAAPPVITISGHLVQGPACPPATLVIDDTGVSIDSATPINPLLIGTPVRVTGAFFDQPCPTVLATTIATNPFQLSLCGQPSPGCEVSLDLCPSPVSGAFLVFGSFGTALIPVSPATGTFLLDPTSMFVFVTGAKTAVCEALHFKIPSSPTFVGATAYFQAAALPPASAPILSNRATVTVSPPSGPCQYFECF